MFYLDKSTQLTPELLSKMLNSFNINEATRLQKYKNYYDGQQDILTQNTDTGDKGLTRPKNKTVINYTAQIANNYCGYLATPGYISYSSENDIEDVMNILRYNDYQAEDAAFTLDLLVFGKAVELMYNDNKAQTRFKMINPTTCFGIFDDSLTEDLIYFVRFFKANQWDNSELYYLDVYDDKVIKHYKMTSNIGTPIFMSEEPHYFGQCPANIAYLPDRKSIFDCIMNKQDSINALISAEITDYEKFADAYMVFEGDGYLDYTTKGPDGLTDVQRMRKNGIIQLPAGTTAKYLTKNANDTQVENIRKFLHDSIYRDAQCPDFSSESFTGGVSSGVAIRYKLTGMENRAGMIEAIMKKAFQRRVEIICGVAALKLGEEVFRDIKIECKRNIPDDLTAIINVINALKGTVSDSTLLAQIPFINDVNAELEALQEQKAANMELYGFGLPAAADDEEEEETE
jgi:SPP1 family phage portal protein